jgi:hypothetical protein
MDLFIGENHVAGGRHGVIHVEASVAGADRIIEFYKCRDLWFSSGPGIRRSAGRIDGDDDGAFGFGRNVPICLRREQPARAKFKMKIVVCDDPQLPWTIIMLIETSSLMVAAR